MSSSCGHLEKRTFGATNAKAELSFDPKARRWLKARRGDMSSRWDHPQFCSSARRGTAFCLLAIVCFQLFCSSLRAQTATNSPAQPIHPAAAVPIPPPPVARSPVDFFRELLAMDPIERRRALKDRPPDIQKAILAKIREYESMKPDQSKLRLLATELRWYLLPRMSQPATNREPQLASVPDHIRPLLKERLREWDLLPPQRQTELLTNEPAIRFLSGIESTNLSTIPPAQLEKLQKGLDEWQHLSLEQRQVIVERFNHFFDLKTEEKDKALRTLSEPERRQIERTLKNFGALTPAQRVQCIRSFETFATMAAEERQQFLKNADRWKLMSPSQRHEWVQLVSTLSMQPPMPPRISPLPLPPPPPKKPASRSTTVVTTNGN